VSFRHGQKNVYQTAISRHGYAAGVGVVENFNLGLLDLP
jgi:hypothetical protein